MSLLTDAEFWIAIGLLVLLGILVYAKVPGMALNALDARGAKIRAELDEALRLRQEAQDLLAQITVQREGAEKKIYTYDLDKIRAGELEDPSLVNEDVIVVKRAAGRVALRDSLFGDLINIINPLNYMRP